MLEEIFLDYVWRLLNFLKVGGLQGRFFLVKKKSCKSKRMLKKIIISGDLFKRESRMEPYIQP